MTPVVVVVDKLFSVLYNVCFYLFFHSFIRLCDYLVISMLHRTSIFSAEIILSTLEDQTSQTIHVKDIVPPIPENVEEQEKLLQVIIVLLFGCFAIWCYQLTVMAVSLSEGRKIVLSIISLFPDTLA
jgi:hypothetical protein